jgi:hypothetical protein
LSEGEGATHAEAEVAPLLLVGGVGWKGGRRGGGGCREGEQLLQKWKKGKVGMCSRPVPCGCIFGKEAEDAALQLLTEGGGCGRRAGKEVEEGEWLRTGSTAEGLQSVGCGGGLDPVEVNGVGSDMEEGALNDGRRISHADAA